MWSQDIEPTLSFMGVTDYRHYINVAGEQVVVYSRKSSGTNTFSYLLSDHQASVASITNSSGAQVVGESFTAFGSRRNPTSWSGAPSNSDLTTIAGITREGYTFQTALGLWMGITHMNGRVEDSITGRFLSADPTVPDPTYSQSYNPYTYVNNNPLSGMDPSGFEDTPDPYIKPINPYAYGTNPNYGGMVSSYSWGPGADAQTVAQWNGIADFIAGGGMLTSNSYVSATGSVVNVSTPKSDGINYAAVNSALNKAFDNMLSGIQSTLNYLGSQVVSNWRSQLATISSAWQDLSNFVSAVTQGDWSTVGQDLLSFGGSLLKMYGKTDAPLVGGIGAAGSAITLEETVGTTVFWNGPGAQAAAEASVAANGGRMLSLAPGATDAEIQAGSINLASTASGNVEMFQTASFQGSMAINVNAANSVWARYELPTLMANPNVTGFTYNILDASGTVACRFTCLK